MDQKNVPTSKPKTVCEKLLIAIRTTSPFRTIRSITSQQDAAVASVTSSKVSLMGPPSLRDRCTRVSKQSIAPVNDQNHSGRVPIFFETATNSSPLNPKPNQLNGSTQKTEQKNCSEAAVLPIQGQENNVPKMDQHGQSISGGGSINGMFSEYIDRAGRKIRSPTHVGGRKVNLKHDSFNDKVSNFIDKTRQRFHSIPSNDGASKTVGFKDELRAKERRHK